MGLLLQRHDPGHVKYTCFGSCLFHILGYIPWSVVLSSEKDEELGEILEES